MQNSKNKQGFERTFGFWSVQTIKFKIQTLTVSQGHIQRVRMRDGTLKDFF